MHISRLHLLSAVLDACLHPFEDIEVKSIPPLNLEAVLESYHFGERARDGGGRFAPGQRVSDAEMGDAYLKKKKKAVLAVGVGAGLTAAALGGRKVVPNLASAAGRIMTR